MYYSNLQDIDLTYKMKLTVLFIALGLGMCTFCSAQIQSECGPRIMELEEHLRFLARRLGDDSILDELDVIRDADKVERFTLSENDPNPYEIKQEIFLSIPESANDAEVVFSNYLGQQIKALDISGEQGEFSIMVYMSEQLLDNYNYSLIVDGVPYIQ